MLTTTLVEIKACSPCKDMWKRLLKGLGVARANKNPLPIERILEISDSCGVMWEDAVWALRAVKGHDGAIRLYACYCAEYVLDILERGYFDYEHGPREAIETAKLFARGLATSEDLTTARDFAEFAVLDAWATWRATLASTKAAGDTKAALAAWGAWDAAWQARTMVDPASDAWNAQYDDFRREFLRLCRLEGEYGEIDVLHASFPSFS